MKLLGTITSNTTTTLRAEPMASTEHHRCVRQSPLLPRLPGCFSGSTHHQDSEAASHQTEDVSVSSSGDD